jgi:hypothetical protein
MNNPAFEFLRQFKQVSDATEELVTKTLKRKFPELTLEQLIEAFELGIIGDYGKVYSIDPQTLMSWVYEYMNARANPVNYLAQPLLDNTIGHTDKGYPIDRTSWEKEANKCYQAYLNGVSVFEFHPHVYDRLMMDNRVECNYFERHMAATQSIRKSKQISIGEYFEHMRAQGNDKIYETR